MDYIAIFDFRHHIYIYGTPHYDPSNTHLLAMVLLDWLPSAKWPLGISFSYYVFTRISWLSPSQVRSFIFFQYILTFFPLWLMSKWKKFFSISGSTQAMVGWAFGIGFGVQIMNLKKQLFTKKEISVYIPQNLQENLSLIQ